MHLEKWLKDDSGFSLIEVICAVAILALVTLPLINYFTYSSIRTIDGREQQTATMAAENVMEELESYSNYEQIEKLTATPSPGAPTPSSTPTWKVTTVSGATPDPKHTYMEREVVVNDKKYQAKVQIDYSGYNEDTLTVKSDEKIGSGSGDPIDSQYNDYEIPRPSEVYSSSNVVAVEDNPVNILLSDPIGRPLSDQLYTALGEFYTIENAATPMPAATYDPDASVGGASVSMATILSGIDRTICVDVDYKSGSNDRVYSIRVYYLYEYAGNKTEVTLEKSDIEKTKFKNIFIFYYLLRADVVNEKVRVRMGNTIPDEEIENMKIYFALQNSDSVTKPSGYNLTRVVSENAKEVKAKYYTNNITSTDFSIENISASGGVSTFVSREKSKRIGRVIVDIYEKADDGSLSGESLAHMETTMAE